MKIFLDTAHLESIVRWVPTGLVDGITTNPSHLAKEGGSSAELVGKICAAVGPNAVVNVQVTETEPQAVYSQAHEIAKMAPNVVVKIPCQAVYLPTITRLVADGVRVNVTLVCTLAQALCMCKAGVAYISPFVGRLDDIDSAGVSLVAEAVRMVKTYDFKTQVLAASVRSASQLHEIIASGAHVATVPPELLEKALHHPLTEKGVEKFLADWRALAVSKFP